MTDFWSNIPSTNELKSEADVESRLVLPLLRALNYEDIDIDSKPPVIFQQGRKGRRPEADFACYWGEPHSRNNSLLVVEAKSPTEALIGAKTQGESYAQNLRAPLLLLTNGKDLEIWQMQITSESECVLRTQVALLAASRGDVERLLTKTSVFEYCRTFYRKDITVTTADFANYEASELNRMSLHGSSIIRMIRSNSTPDQAIEFESSQLLGRFPIGAVVVAPSGYGKTTLSREVFKQAIEERRSEKRKSLPFFVPLPDLEQSNISLLDFIRQRLFAHHPGVTPAYFSQILRDIGAIVICDSFDRTTTQFRKKVTTEFTNFLRDYPRIQIFIFSRPGTVPNLQVPQLELQPLSDKEIREIENVVLCGEHAQNFSITSMMSQTLRALCVNPLLLYLTLDYWKRERRYPQAIEFLFRSWLETIIETEPSDPVAKLRREHALTALAEATVIAPIPGTEALAQLNSQGIPSDTFNELIQCNAIQMTGAVVELQHDSLADYLRAKALAAKSEEDGLRQIQNLSLPADSFFPVLAMAQLQSRSLQSALWRRLSSSHISIYLDALRYRFDVSNELRELDEDQLSRDYLGDLLSGIEIPLLGFFPEMRSTVIQRLTGDEDATLGVTGLASTAPNSLWYKLHASTLGQPNVTVGLPSHPGTIRAVNLDQSGMRIDSARLLGMNLLKQTIQDAVSGLELKGGATWAAERLFGRVRFMAKHQVADLSLSDHLDKLENTIKSLSGDWIDEGAFYGRRQRFSVQSLLDDISILRKTGVTSLDPWWSRLGWDERALMQEEDVYRRVLDEEYRRMQTIYAEIVQSSFPTQSSEMIYFPILPVRWKLTVQRRNRQEGLSTIHFHWFPVASWQDAGADVSFSENGLGSEPDWKAARDELVTLGRQATRIPSFGGWTLHFAYDGTEPAGYFSGATPVTNKICSWLKNDIEHLFKGLPAADRAF